MSDTATARDANGTQRPADRQRDARTRPAKGGVLGDAWDRLRPAPSPAARPATDAPLTDDESELLAFESQPWPRSGAKMAAIRERFGWSETRYYQALRALLDRPAALEHSPQLVHRLRAQLAVGHR